MKLLSGETRASQLRAEPQPAEAEPECLAWVQGYAREAWDQAVQDL